MKKEISKKKVEELRRNARSMVRELGLLNDAYFEINVTLVERHLLIELNTCQTATMGEIAARLLLEKSSASRLIAKTVKKGYIVCTTDEKDKRKRYLTLTQKGKKILRVFEPIAFNQTKEALLTLTPVEIETVYRGVSLYAEGLRRARIGEELKANTTKMETFSEITNRLDQLGYVLDSFKSEDHEGLYAIFQEVVDSGTEFPYENSSIDEFNRQFFASGTRIYVCRDHDGKVVGGFYIKANFSGRSSHVANAAYMVYSSYRGKGIGSLLVKASLHLVKKLGFHALQFNMVLSQNVRAVALYEKMGFSLVGNLPDAIRTPQGSFQDGYIMYRKLEDI